MDASLRGAILEIPPWFVYVSNLGPLSGSGTVHSGTIFLGAEALRFDIRIIFFENVQPVSLTYLVTLLP